MKPRRLKALFKRELRDILRDKKTIIMMIVVPVLLYPLLIIGMTLLMTAIISGQEEKTYRVAFYDDKESVLSDKIENIIKQADDDELTYDIKIVKKSWDAEQEYTDALDNDEIDAYVKQEDDGSIDICYLSARTDSETAAYGLREVFALYRDELRRQKIEGAGLDVDEIFYPVEYELEDKSSTEESLGNRIGSFLPFFIITVILLGAIYPAIDVTAGERERGTLETLLTLPVTNLEMIMSKFLAVSVIACVTAMLNVISMGGAVAFLVMSSLNSLSDLNISIDLSMFVPGILFTVIVMMCFAMLVTAVCMCVCIFAHNFKEANNYITPVMLVFMFASYAAVLPDLELSAGTAAIPVVNVSLLVRELFKFNYDYTLFLVVLVSTVAYSLIAVWVLAHIYNSEDVLFSEGFRNVRIFERRRDMKKGQIPGTGDVLLLLSVTLLLMFYIGNYAYMKLGIGGVAIQQAIVLIMPLLFAWYMKTDMKSLFRIKRTGISKFIGGVLLGAGAYMFATLISILLSPVFSRSVENTQALDELINSAPLPLLILTVSLMPAIGEELMFRGFTFGTLSARYRAVYAVVITAVLFAAYHLSVIRFFALMPLSLALTYAAYKTDSIYVSMLMHLINNTFSVIQARYTDEIDRMLPFLSEETQGSNGFVMLAVMGAVLVLPGLYLLKKSNLKNVTNSTQCNK